MQAISPMTPSRIIVGIISRGSSAMKWTVLAMMSDRQRSHTQKLAEGIFVSTR